MKTYIIMRPLVAFLMALPFVTLAHGAEFSKSGYDFSTDDGCVGYVAYHETEPVDFAYFPDRISPEGQKAVATHIATSVGRVSVWHRLLKGRLLKQIALSDPEMSKEIIAAAEYYDGRMGCFLWQEKLGDKTVFRKDEKAENASMILLHENAWKKLLAPTHGADQIPVMNGEKDRILIVADQGLSQEWRMAFYADAIVTGYRRSSDAKTPSLTYQEKARIHLAVCESVSGGSYGQAVKKIADRLELQGKSKNVSRHVLWEELKELDRALAIGRPQGSFSEALLIMHLDSIRYCLQRKPAAKAVEVASQDKK